MVPDATTKGKTTAKHTVKVAKTTGSKSCLMMARMGSMPVNCTMRLLVGNSICERLIMVLAGFVAARSRELRRRMIMRCVDFWLIVMRMTMQRMSRRVGGW